MYKSIKLFECPTFELQKLYQRVWKNDGGSIISSFYNGYEFCNDVKHTLDLFISGDINACMLVDSMQYHIENFHKYNDIQYPCPVGDKTDISKEV